MCCKYFVFSVVCFNFSALTLHGNDIFQCHHHIIFYIFPASPYKMQARPLSNIVLAPHKLNFLVNHLPLLSTRFVEKQGYSNRK